MAIASKNSPLYGVSGKVGNLVMRQRNGKTIIAKAPDRRRTAPTAAQLEQHKRFTEMVKTKYKK
jgi:hypothetical protein